MGITYTPNNSSLLGSSLTGTLAAGTTAVLCTVDLSGVDVGLLQIPITFGASIAATSGVQVGAEPEAGATPTADTQSVVLGVIAATASTTQRRGFRIPTGKYAITLTNLDGTNNVTTAAPTLDTWVK